MIKCWSPSSYLISFVVDLASFLCHASWVDIFIHFFNLFSIYFHYCVFPPFLKSLTLLCSLDLFAVCILCFLFPHWVSLDSSSFTSLPHIMVSSAYIKPCKSVFFYLYLILIQRSLIITHTVLVIIHFIVRLPVWSPTMMSMTYLSEHSL